DVDNAIAYAARNVDKYDWLFVDSLSEIAEVILRKNLEEAKDPRQAYGATQDAVLDKVRRMRDMPGINVAIICQQADGRLSMPGQKLGPKIPYMFDEIFCVVSKGEGDDTQYFVQTEGDAKFLAGDRSGKLRRLEPMHLGGIAAKIRGEDAAEAKKKIDEKLAAQANKPAEQAKKESK
ncbi:MAG: hypothetical protein ACPG6R_11075, partial [Aequoribacter sp.]|uniref:hypothetical protein n=1 Tax=Aequoribacter sp. TaxID=2847771 RepID=UPI003C34E5B8